MMNFFTASRGNQLNRGKLLLVLGGKASILISAGRRPHSRRSFKQPVELGSAGTFSNTPFRTAVSAG
jgi:hypothetical protein